MRLRCGGLHVRSRVAMSSAERGRSSRDDPNKQLSQHVFPSLMLDLNPTVLTSIEYEQTQRPFQS